MARDCFSPRYLVGLILLTAFILNGCVRNEPWRTATAERREIVYTPDFNPDKCEPDDPCAKALVEVFEDESGDKLFEINYIEFTERGNVFDTERTHFVLDRIENYATSTDGVITIVFIHGWKNNASTRNENVQAFRNRLKRFAKSNQFIQGRHVVGVFIGWRGTSVSLPLIKELSFWDRKAVAEKIGKGGVTDILLDLESYDSKQRMNVLVVVGHSFGGAILLSAYSELILDRVKSLAKHNGTLPAGTSVADALVLINPAIEANEMLRVKEAIIKHQKNWNGSTPNLMRVLSTKADKATHRLFPLGQLLGTVVTWNQEQLSRGYLKANENPETLKYLHERTLDKATVGNFLPFHTQEMVTDDGSDVPWAFKDLCNGSSRQVTDEKAPIFDCSGDDPVQFVYTPKEFMKGHSDIFNDEVSAYIITNIDTALRQSIKEPTIPQIETQELQTKSQRFEQDFQRTYENIKGADPNPQN